MLEAQRQKEKEQNGLLFAKKMRQLKAMIDKRTKEKIAWLKECEDETLLSKKTSFSSFYNLEDDVQRVDSSERNKLAKSLKRERRRSKREDKH